MTDIDVSGYAELPAHLSWQVVACMRELWPSVFTGDLTWLTEPYPPGSGAHHFVAQHDGVLVSYASVLPCTVDLAGELFATAGLGNVLTSRPYRGRGFAGRVLAEADRWVARQPGFDVACLFCDDDLRAFYGPRGWADCPGGTLVGGAGEQHRYAATRMMRFLSPRGRERQAALTAGPVRVDHPW